jgi:hypothetical protein
MNSLFTRGFTLILLIAGFSLFSIAQQLKDVSITNTWELYTTYTFDASEKADLISSLGEDQFREVDNACRENQWPSGISTMGKRDIVRDKFTLYKAKILASFGEKSILLINPGDNLHMPLEMRSEKPFYFVINTSGISETTTEKVKEASITDPGQLYSTYNFSAEEKDKITSTVGEAQYEAINNSCHENQWPSGLSTLDSRNTVRDKMKEYHVNVVMVLGDVSIVQIDPDRNRHMPPDMLAQAPFYFIIGNNGVDNSGGGTAATTSTAADPSLSLATMLAGDAEAGYDYPEARILDPDLILADHEFEGDEIWDLMMEVGDDYEYVDEFCRESAFPEAINTPEKRQALVSEIKNYKTHLILEGDYIKVLEIRPDENTHMPENMIPDSTIYFVIELEGAEVVE